MGLAPDGTASIEGLALAELLPGASVFASQDIFEVREHIARTYCPHNLHIEQRGGTLDAWLNHRRFGKLDIGVMAYGRNVSIEGIEDKDMLLLMQPLRGSAEIGTVGQSAAISPHLASVVDTADLRRMRWSADCTQRVVQISNRVLEDYATMLIGRPLTRKLRFAETMPIEASLASCWNYAALLSMEVAGRRNDEGSTLIDNLETLFILKLLESHPNSYSEQLQPQPCRIAPHHVRKVERFIVDHADQPVTMEQLVEVGGVSARALFDGFRRFRGTSPMAYLKTVRLERARHDLQNAGPADTVTGIACRWGFYQFGRFAAEYRRIYGELPSQTLRKFN